MNKLTAGVIHRLELPLEGTVEFHLPGFRRMLHVAEHRNHEKSGNAFEVWYERNAFPHESELAKVRFRIVGTGSPITFRTGPTYAEYLGTVTTHHGLYVWHVYVEYPVVEEA
ncbi:DUF7352 domain-containing protein [Rhodococcus sp. 06-418-5]|uniref:DUF7352 domain-containing protein n=1 Tax=Rhodococcus sp. 06-418-5 TaxID=2022507 RepID=UPI003F912E4E